MAKSNKGSLSPELIRLLKIFGIGSLVFVLVMSFFNEKRANNSGREPSPMRMTDPERIYFKNVRSSYYDIEIRRDAKMTVYRHGKRSKDTNRPTLVFSIIINQHSDEAYIFLEPNIEENPIRVKWSIPGKNQEGEITFEGGDKFAHLEFAQKITPILQENAIFEVRGNEKWVPLWEDEKEKNAVMVTIEDYQKLIGLVR
ncbi:hypothetical protein MMU07_08445 [Aquiflexum sp. LQ15W]|uniref:hypothetical protein n=1 Tax=Cognataquiflexum nitidum TaxID=2922272 RepID=UPI001F14120E|nr:hypothetical protein [Cognataquiflexum nitidum]MCH6199605.1 hypothetical protein [Cognataquiflexum nitidum]